MNKFYINTDNKISGPYTAKQILEMNIRNDTLVKEESINEWVPFSKFDWDVAEQKLIQKQPESSDLNKLTDKTDDLTTHDDLPKLRREVDRQKASPKVNKTEQNGKGKYWILITCFLISSIVLGILYLIASDDLSYYRSEYHRANRERNEYRNKYESASSTTSSLRSEISSLEHELDNAKSELSDLKNKVSNTYPLIITDIEIANVTYDGDIITNYGNSIYESTTMYLQPRIKYTGLCSGTKTLKVKLYCPDGSLSTGSYSTYSYSDDAYLYEGENSFTLSGWGNENKGNWRSGTYRIEIWYENTCLKSKTFTIY